MTSGTIEEETSATIEAIRRILAEEGATLADVVRVTTYLEDTRDFGRYNKVFGEYFKDATLARTTVEARAVINTKIEIEASPTSRSRPDTERAQDCWTANSKEDKRDQIAWPPDLRERAEGHLPAGRASTSPTSARITAGSSTTPPPTPIAS